MKSDVNLQRDVLEELDWEPRVDAAQIGVTAQYGIVNLAGHVATNSQRHVAEQVAKRVHGVRGVANDLVVQPGEGHLREDADIAAAAVHALAWHAEVPQERMQVSVRNGWVTLEGTVHHRHQKVAAERAVRHLVGARGVTNDLVVETPKGATKSRATVDDIRSSLQAALRRSATVDSRKIGVEVEDRRVILRGDVRSHAEFEEAERIAWLAPGIREVENCLTITPWGCGPAEEWGY